MTARAPEQDVALLLQTAGLGNFNQTGTATIKCGPPRATVEPGAGPVQLYVDASGGPPPAPYFNAAGSYYSTNIQAVVRAAADSFGAGLALARQVREALHTHAPATYSGCWANESEPNRLGANDSGQWEFTVNFTLTWVA
jgi:hypothetical protein